MNHSFVCLAWAIVAAFGLNGVCHAGSFNKVASLHNSAIDGVLATDASGNLLVETDTAVVELIAASGYTRQRTLHTFSDDSLGTFPEGGVTLAGKSILGVTSEGYSGVADFDGSIFNLGTEHTPAPVSLHNFVDGSTEGYYALSGLTAGPNNRYYGTTQYGGQAPYGQGSVFEVSPAPNNPRFSSIYGFGFDTAPGGSSPTSGRLAIDSTGLIYGATTGGGIYDGGVIFTLQKSRGAWQEKVIFGFSNDVGQLHPVQGSNVVIGPYGSLFFCAGGGQYGYGGIVKLAQNRQGNWNETPIYQFGARAYDPDAEASCAITIDATSGMIVGVTNLGGRSNLGTLFTLIPISGARDQWEFAIVHNFAGAARDGAEPFAAPLMLGASYYGSSSTFGVIPSVVWRYTP